MPFPFPILFKQEVQPAECDSPLVRLDYEGPVNPHFSQGFYCGGASGHVYCVALPRAPRRTVEYACGALGRAPVSEAAYPRPSAPPRYETL